MLEHSVHTGLDFLDRDCRIHGWSAGDRVIYTARKFPAFFESLLEAAQMVSHVSYTRLIVLGVVTWCSHGVLAGLILAVVRVGRGVMCKRVGSRLSREAAWAASPAH